MRRSLDSLWSVVAVSAALLLTLGCSQSPMTPEESSGSSAEYGPSSSGSVSLASDNSGPSGGGDSQESSQTIDGLKGGSVGAGDWKVIVPAGAYIGEARITVTVPDRAVPMCQLDISPASKNNFLVPVSLYYKCKSVDETLTRDIRWWNPVAGRWEVIPSSPDLARQYRTALLSHFSDYMSGRSGW